MLNSFKFQTEIPSLPEKRSQKQRDPQLLVLRCQWWTIILEGKENEEWEQETTKNS